MVNRQFTCLGRPRSSSPSMVGALRVTATLPTPPTVEDMNGFAAFVKKTFAYMVVKDMHLPQIKFVVAGAELSKIFNVMERAKPCHRLGWRTTRSRSQPCSRYFWTSKDQVVEAVRPQPKRLTAKRRWVHCVV